MSGVLSPVGPLPPRVYWIRRLIVLGLPLLVIVIIVIAVSGGGSKSPSAGSGAPDGSASSTASSGSTGKCAPGDLTAQLSTSETTYQVGASPVFTGTIKNISAQACRLTTSPANESWKVESYPATWWTTSGCPHADTATTKTLQPNATRQVTITWDGHRLEPGCKRGETAQPGTYHLSAVLDGVTARQVTFHFTKNTQ